MLIFFFGVFFQKFRPSKFNILLQKKAENSQTSESQEKIKDAKVHWDVADNRYAELFFFIRAKKKIKKTPSRGNQWF